MVLMCEIGLAEGKPQVEQYGLDALAASAESVVAGLGPLAAGLARLAGDAARAVTLDAMEVLVIERGRELLRGLVQLSLDAQAEREVRLPQVTGEDGVPRTRAERGHARPVVTRLGEVRVQRIAYRAGVKGVPSLFPRDAVLNLPPLGYSWALQRLAEMFARSGSYEQAHEFVYAATGVRIGKRQLEQITARAAADAEQFYQDRLQDQAGPATAGEEGSLPPLAISADGKGVAMRPEARRRRTRAPEQRVRTFGKRAGTGEKKGCKRMAGTGCVFDVIAQQPRTPEQVMRPDPGCGKKPPRAGNRWYACDITAGRDVTIGKIFDEAGRRDPGHARTWIALADGDVHQLGLIRAQAAARGITVVILVDFIHVLEYLWKAAWCFHAPRDPAMEDWVTAQGLDILHGLPRRGHHPDRAARRGAPAETRRRARQDHPENPVLPGEQAAVPGLPHRPGERLADRHRRHRGRLPPPRPGPDGHHRRPLGPGRSPGHPLAPRHQRQRRHQRLPGLPHHPGTPAQPPEPLRRQPRTRRLTLTPKEPHPRGIHALSIRPVTAGERGRAGASGRARPGVPSAP
jgi:hypothetical protein